MLFLDQKAICNNGTKCFSLKKFASILQCRTNELLRWTIASVYFAKIEASA